MKHHMYYLLLPVAFLSGCIVKAQYSPIYPDSDIPARDPLPEAIPVYESEAEIPGAYYIIGVVRTSGNIYAKKGSHLKKLKQVAQEHHGDAAAQRGSESVICLTEPGRKRGAVEGSFLRSETRGRLDLTSVWGSFRGTALRNRSPSLTLRRFREPAP